MKKRFFFLTGLTALALSLAATASYAAKPDAPKSNPPVLFPVEKAPVDRSNKERITSHADTLGKVTPAVVSIRTEQILRVSRSRSWQEQMIREYYGAPSSRLEKRTGLGSGTIIHADGYILTNRHVISDETGAPAGEITVELSDKREFSAKVIGSDPSTDIAIIKIDGEKLPVAKVADSDALRVGDIVFAIGNPMGVGMTVTSGIVSALGRKVGILGEGGIESFIQTDASINQGNSGGPLVDADGRVVGVNTAIASSTGGSIGIGFAVPSNFAVSIVENLVNNGTVARGYFGVAGKDVTPPLAEKLRLPTPQGALITHVEDSSPAGKGGVKVDDTIVSINNDPVESWETLRYLTSKLKAGEKAQVEIYRNGKKQTLTVVTGLRAGLFEGHEKLDALSDDLRKQYNIPTFVRAGVVITKISPNSIFSGEVPEGTVVLSVNGAATRTPEDVTKALRKGKENRLRVFTGERIFMLTVRP